MNDLFAPGLRILRGIGEQKIARRMRRSLPFLIVLAGLTLAAQSFGWLDRYEAFGLDVSSLLRSQTKPDVMIVKVDDEAYRRLSKSRSPFDTAGLEHILAIVARAHPAAIGVDIETSDARFASMRVPRAASLAWTEEIRKNDDACGTIVRPACEELEPIDILGGRNPLPDQICKIGCVGSELFIDDGDDVVRRAARAIAVKGGTVDSFAWSIVAACAANGDARCVERRADDPPTERLEEHLISWSAAHARWPSITESMLETFAADPAWKGSPLRDRIVIVGGYYTAGNDRHPTPVGVRPGPEIWAQIVQDELDGRVQTLGEIPAFLLDILCGLTIVAIYAVLEFRLAVAISLVAIPVGSLLASIVLFAHAAYWFNFAPMFFGTIAHQLIDHGRIYVYLRRLHPDEAEEAEDPRRRPVAPEKPAAKEPPPAPTAVPVPEAVLAPEAAPAPVPAAEAAPEIDAASTEHRPPSDSM